MTHRNSDHLVGRIVSMVRPGINWQVAKELGPEHAVVFAYIVENTNGNGKAPITDMHKSINITRRTLTRTIADLETEGLIKKEEGKNPTHAWINANGCYDFLKKDVKEASNEDAR